MTLANQLYFGFSAYKKALEIIFFHGLWWYFAFPFLLNLILFFAGFSFAASLVKPAQQWFIESTGLETADFFLSKYLQGFVLFFIMILIKVFFFFVFAMFGGYITLILLSPVLAVLSERTEKILTGKIYRFNFRQFIKDILRSVVFSFRNMFFQTTISILIFIISFTPVIGLVSPFAFFIVSAYFYGFSFMDYSLERKKISVQNSTNFILNNKGLAISTGTVFSLLLLVPYIGFFVAGFAAIISTVAATITVERTVSS